MTNRKKWPRNRTICHPRIRGVEPDSKIRIPVPDEPDIDAMGAYEKMFDIEEEQRAVASDKPKQRRR